MTLNKVNLEKRMYTTKSILDVAPVFLKRPERIEALMFLYFVALMIVSGRIQELGERTGSYISLTLHSFPQLLDAPIVS